MRRRLLAICLIATLVALLAVGTYANYTHIGTAVNVITTPGIDLVLNEKMDNGEDFPAEGVNIMPGDIVSKIVTLSNEGTAPCFVRIALEKSVNDDLLSADGCLEMDINTTDWTYSDGYYYYNSILGPDETTTPLFTQVTIVGEAVSNDYMNKELKLDVKAYAVQSDNNGASALEASGWPE